MDLEIKKSEHALKEDDLRFFTERINQPHRWRLYDRCKRDCLFLDIETSGYYGDITVIGLFDGVETMIFVKGFNLDKRRVLEVLSHYSTLITFNGASFDLPVIERFFGTSLPHHHIDLRHSARRIGLSGGLKHIEKEIGITRPEDVTTVVGSDAVYLWNMWESTREKKFLELLVRYNEEDIINLKPLAEHIVRESTRQLLS